MLVTEASGRISIISCLELAIKRTFTQEGTVIDSAVMRSEVKAATSSSNN